MERPGLRCLRNRVSRRTSQLSIVAIAALVFAFSYLAQPTWANELAHYDLVRALAVGSPNVDASRGFPLLHTGDLTRLHGHFYSTKAPGLAAASLPPYLALRTAGVVTTTNPKSVVWALHLWSIVLPAAVLLLLVRRRAESVEPGFGTIAAVSIGIGSLMLPFSTLFFAHVLSATLGFAAFVLLSHKKGSALLAFLGGLVAGLAFNVEYTLGVVALVLVLVVLEYPEQRLRRLGLYSLGVALGALPAFVFNTWAFGSPFHLPQEGWHGTGGTPLPGLLGLTHPSVKNVLIILFYPGGIGPILLPAIAGAFLLWRRGARLEAALPMLIAGLFLVFNAASVDPFGGASPGPRFMIATLPFLAVPLAVALRAFPGATLGLIVGGGAFMVAATLTHPLEALDGHVIHRLVTGHWIDSITAGVGLRGSIWDVPFLIAIGVAAAAAIAVTPWRFVVRRDLFAFLVALCAWVVVSNTIDDLSRDGWHGEATGIAATVFSAALIAAGYRLQARPRLR